MGWVAGVIADRLKDLERELVDGGFFGSGQNTGHRGKDNSF
jgi:hypothetical protein